MKNDSSEQTAMQLYDVLMQMGEAMVTSAKEFKRFDCQARKTYVSMYERALEEAVSRVALYMGKASTATWVTRWYWTRKYNKAKHMLGMIRLCPPPVHHNCRCQITVK